MRTIQYFENRDKVFHTALVIMVGVESHTINPQISAGPLA